MEIIKGKRKEDSLWNYFGAKEVNGDWEGLWARIKTDTGKRNSRRNNESKVLIKRARNDVKKYF